MPLRLALRLLQLNWMPALVQMAIAVAADPSALYVAMLSLVLHLV